MEMIILIERQGRNTKAQPEFKSLSTTAVGTIELHPHSFPGLRNSLLQLLGVWGTEFFPGNCPPPALPQVVPFCGQATRVQRLGLFSQFRTTLDAALAPEMAGGPASALLQPPLPNPVLFHPDICFYRKNTQQFPKENLYFRVCFLEPDGSCEIYCLYWTILQRSKCHINNYIWWSWDFDKNLVISSLGLLLGCVILSLHMKWGGRNQPSIEDHQ